MPKLNHKNSLYVPVGLELNKLLDAENLELHIDKIHWITNFLILSRIFNKGSEWTPIHSKVFKAALGKKLYAKAKQLAIDHGLIEVELNAAGKPSYAKATSDQVGFPMSYRLTVPYAEQRWHRIQVHDKQVLKYLGRRRNPAKLTPAENHLWKNVQRVKILDIPDLENGTDEEIVFDCIRERNFRKKRGPYKRFHTTLTNCQRELRESWHVGGETLVELDICNCQPLLFAWLVGAFLENNWQKINFLISKLYTKPTNLSLSSTVPYVSLEDVPNLILPLKNRDLLPKNALHLIELCEGCDFYEFFVEEAGLDASDKAVRDANKIKILQQFFDDWNRPYFHRYEFPPILKTHFPAAYDVCSHIKALEFQSLARLMQAIEGYLVIDVIAEELRVNYADMPIVTVHDAMFTTPKWLPILRGVVQDAFWNRLGVHVGFKGENVKPLLVDGLGSCLTNDALTAPEGAPVAIKPSGGLTSPVEQDALSALLSAPEASLNI